MPAQRTRPFDCFFLRAGSISRVAAYARPKQHRCGAHNTNKYKDISTRRWQNVQNLYQRGHELSAGNATITEAKPTHRSRVTNGSAVLPGIDGRSTWARRLRDLIELHVSDLGGSENISEAERSIVRRAATMTVELERLEARFAIDGEASARDLDLYQRTAGNLRRLLESVGLQRRARNVTPDPLAYARSKASAP